MLYGPRGVPLSVSMTTVMVMASPGGGVNPNGAKTSLVPPGIPVNLPIMVPALFLKVAVTPGARPPTLNLTVSLNPFFEVSVMVVLPLEPCVTVRNCGDRLRKKSALAAGIMFNGLLPSRLPSEAFMI